MIRRGTVKKRFLLNPIVLRCVYRIINGVNYALSSWERLKWIVVGGLIVVGVFIPEITWFDFLILSLIYLLFKCGYRRCFIRLSNSIVLIKGRENSISQSVLDDSVYKTINSRNKDDRQQVLNLFIEDIESALLNDGLEAMNSIRIQSHPTIINKIISSDKINEVYLIEKIGDKKSSYCYTAEFLSLISEKELLKAVKEDKEWVYQRYFKKRTKEVLKLKRRAHGGE